MPQRRLPDWFRVSLSTNGRYAAVRSRLQKASLHTVCESAACPNRNECWNAGTATFLILGGVCTRHCAFCNIPAGTPAEPDRSEPERVASAVASLGLSYAVVTSVTRDDLADGGAGIYAETIGAIVRRSPACRVEVLVPDFLGSAASLEAVLDAGPSVLNHNIETVPSLYPRVRPQADYERSLRLLARAKARGTVTKSGLMLGLGESPEDVLRVAEDLHAAGCDILTIGQYLRPGTGRHRVEKYYRPEEFDRIAAQCRDRGIRQVAAGPRVRSSYRAEQVQGCAHS